MSVLSFEHVHVSQDGLPTLQDISLSLNAGDFVYLIGKTGSGKSTFFKSIYAELPIDAGQASVAGYSLNQLKSADIPYDKLKEVIVECLSFFMHYDFYNKSNID